MLEWIAGLGGLVIGAIGLYQAHSRQQAERRARVHQRRQRQLDEFYAPALANLEQLRDLDARLGPVVFYNASTLNKKVVPLCRGILNLFHEKRGLVEHSTMLFRASLDAELEELERVTGATWNDLYGDGSDRRRAGVLPNFRRQLYEDVKRHHDRLRDLLAK